jgi:hypothetical protein
MQAFLEVVLLANFGNGIAAIFEHLMIKKV